MNHESQGLLQGVMGLGSKKFGFSDNKMHD